ncbi:ankyrin [Mytilinidion resinicola]|uniref:Ankyrin n=1 Tax=Mytilinidion resinicola TaxID=574789 RepID=A0A6A6YRN5_9PEZI|nr:ankyrin [Mytilinidion resinicola]KAF2810704.1 ankyrin [Mytilinidion resinicola]
MEPISAVASIVTLIALAKEISFLTTDLFRGLHSAPRELARLQEQTNLIVKELQCLESNANQSGIDQLLDGSEIRTLGEALKVAKCNIGAIHKECGNLGQKSKRRIMWVLFEKKKAEEYLMHLQKTEISLSVVLQLTNMKMTSTAYVETKQHFKKTQDAIETLRIERQLQTPSALVRPNQNTSKTAPKSQRYLNALMLSEFWKWLLACELIILTTTDGSQLRYDCLAIFLLPTLARRLAVKISLSFQRPSSTWSNIVLLGGRLSMVNYVPNDSEIIMACRKGDLVAVRDLFRRGKASPNDVSERSKTLLWHAAASGSTELAEYLIHEGTPVTSSILLAAAYWRQPQIARLCLNNDADPEVIGVEGYTAAILLFGSSRKREPQTEFIEILACNSFSIFDAQDDCGWTALHRAAAFGTHEDVRSLLRLQASVDVRTYNLEWTPLFCAVCFGNLETMQELWSCYDNPGQTRDLREWNLLHVAAGAGRFNVMPFLLKNGVDPQAVSQATSRFVPPSLVDRSVTPSDVAKSCGEDSYRKWTEIPKTTGFKSKVSPIDIDWSLEEMQGRYGGFHWERGSLG